MDYVASRQGDRFFLVEVMAEQLYANILAGGNTFDIEEAKDLFIKCAIRHVKNSAYFHGVGNCELMADTALLEAIFKPHEFDIHYVRFTRDEGEVDEINCIVLGDWPNPGCQIIAPWFSEDKRIFPWQGSIEDTPVLKTNSQDFNCFQEIIHISLAEKEKFKKQLDEFGYSRWLESSAREENMRNIRDYASQFFTAVSPRAHQEKLLK